MKLDFETDSPALLSSRNSENDAALTNDSTDTSQKLSAGIKAARDGDFGGARVLLLEVSEVEPDNEDAWLWLGSISQYPEELLIFLNNALAANPHNERALQWAAATKAVISKSIVERGIEAARENQDNFAKQCFLQAVALDDGNETAWLRLAEVSAEIDEKNTYLEKVLTINPENETALSSLEILKQQPSEAPQTSPEKTAEQSVMTLEQLEEIYFGGEIVEYDESARGEAQNSGGSLIFDLEDITEFENSAFNFSNENHTAATRFGLTDEAENILEDFDFAASDGEKTRALTDDANESHILDMPDSYFSGSAPEISRRAAEESSPIAENSPSYYADENDLTTAESEQIGDFPAFVGETEAEPPTEAPDAAREPAVKNKKILVVDDSRTVRKLIADKLEKCGHTVVCAVDGKEALLKIGEILPDLVLLDIAMPQMDGYQVCRKIRSVKETKNVPVVMISGKDGFFDKVRGRIAGASGYVTKPFGPDALMKIVESYVVEK